MKIPEPLRARMSQPEPPPLEQLRLSLSAYFADADGIDEVRADMRHMARVNTTPLRQNLRALEAVLADPPADGELARLVGWTFNWVLEDPSDAGATAFLREVADLITEVLAE